MEEFTPSQVILNDPFWLPRLETNSRRAIFHQWAQLEASGCIDNFRIAAGEKDGFREGWFFSDSDAYKWLDAASRISAIHPDPELSARMEAFIAQLGRTQSPDGYLFTYNQIHFPGTRWVNLQIEHELYCHGHLIEAGVSNNAADGSTELLTIARRAADRLVDDFLGADPERTPGHEEIELALIRLYRATGHIPYLDLAQHFLEQRGRSPRFAFSIFQQNTNSTRRGNLVRRKRQAYMKTHPQHAAFSLPENNPARQPPGISLRMFASALSGKFFQQHAPIRQQDVPVGHAVRFGYLETAIAMLHRTRPDPTLLPGLERAWERMVTRRMYVTGGIGSLPVVEGFGRDYELNPWYAYTETCAALASMFWSWEMALITGEAKYSDLFEWQLYNAASAGMGLSGENYLYNNPLACRGGVTRKAWYEVPCCPSNLSRTLADLGKYIYSFNQNELWVHQYIGSQASLQTAVPTNITIESGLPFTGKATLRLDPVIPVDLTLYLRIPSWSARTQVTINEMPVDQPPSPLPTEPSAQGYNPRLSQFLPIHRTWQPKDTVEITFDMSICKRIAHHKVRGYKGKTALTRGPLVYCLESPDNPGVDLFNCRLDPTSLHTEFDAGLLGGIEVLRGTSSDGKPLTFIPYSFWANRGESQMNVWIKTKI